MFENGYRVRSTDTTSVVQPAGYDYYNQTFNGQEWVNDPVIHFGVQPFTVGSRKSIEDQPHPNYLQRRRDGEIILGDLRIVTETWDNSITSATLGPYYNSDQMLWPQGYKQTISIDAVPLVQNVAPPLMDLSMDGESMRALALQKAYAKVNSSSLMLGVTVGELSQTVAMLRRPIGGAQDLVKQMLRSKKRLSKKTVKSVTQAINNTWLEYRYGWRPLLLEAENIGQLAKKKWQACERRRLVVRAEERNAINDEQSFSLKPLTWNNSWRLTGVVRHSSRYRACAGVVFDVVSSTKYQEMASATGIRARDLPATAWELIPYSFVVDWFLGVGTWLQAITPVPGISIRGNWVTTVWDYHRSADGGTVTVALSVPDPINPTFSYAAHSYSENVVERRTNQSLQLTPVLKAKPLSTLHTVDAVALTTNRVLNGLKSFWRR